jgi:quercetin dioxygenase-like cupin family protein
VASARWTVWLRLSEFPIFKHIKDRGKTMNLHAIDWNEVPWERVRDGVERKAFSGEGATVALNRLQPGHEPRPHSHPNEQIAYVISGTIDFHIGEEVVRVSGGGLLVIPPNANHWGVVVGDEPVLNLDVFTPKRSEYAS